MSNERITHGGCVLMEYVIPAVRSDNNRSKKGEIIVDWTATFTSPPLCFCDDDDDDDDDDDFDAPVNSPCSIVPSAIRRN